MTIKNSTLDFAGAIRLLQQGKAVTRQCWTRSRILVKDNELVIQHEITMPGVTPWRFTFADMTACDYVEAFFNSEDTTCPSFSGSARVYPSPSAGSSHSQDSPTGITGHLSW